MTKVISGFPGIGKSVVHQNASKYGWRILDSDSSTFSWVEQGVRNLNFPANYMSHIRGNIGFARYILISSHDNVRAALKESNIDYTLVYPAVELMDEYLERYHKRGSSVEFTKFIAHNWKTFIEEIEKETFPTLVKLTAGQYLSDVLEVI